MGTHLSPDTSPVQCSLDYATLKQRLKAYLQAKINLFFFAPKFDH